MRRGSQNASELFALRAQKGRLEARLKRILCVKSAKKDTTVLQRGAAIALLVARGTITQTQGGANPRRVQNVLKTTGTTNRASRVVHSADRGLCRNPVPPMSQSARATRPTHFEKKRMTMSVAASLGELWSSGYFLVSSFRRDVERERGGSSL